jgi:hypothetical protein
MTLGFQSARKEVMAKPPMLRTRVSPTDVFAIWRTTVEMAAQEFSSRVLPARAHKRRRLGFFALPPRQRLQLAQMQQLERAGLRIVHVPSSLAGADLESVSAYLTQRLQQKMRDSALSLRTRGAGQLPDASAAAATASIEAFVDDEESSEQLEAINDPDNAVDDLT